jgi:hypothetical protein
MTVALKLKLHSFVDFTQRGEALGKRKRIGTNFLVGIHD